MLIHISEVNENGASRIYAGLTPKITFIKDESLTRSYTIEATPLPARSFIKDAKLFFKTRDAAFNRISIEVTPENITELQTQYRNLRLLTIALDLQDINNITSDPWKLTSKSILISISITRNQPVFVRSMRSDIPPGEIESILTIQQRETGFSCTIPEVTFIKNAGLFKSWGFEKVEGIVETIGKESSGLLKFAKYTPNEEVYRIHKLLERNVKLMIQFNHYSLDSVFCAMMNYFPGMEDEEFVRFVDRPVVQKVNPDKQKKFVPKNGEKFAGNRLMEFRDSLSNLMMATAVTRLYSRINVNENNLGCRITDGELIPYIYTYNIYSSTGTQLALIHKHWKYFDISKYFDNVDYALIEKAVLYFDDSDASRDALSLIRKAMRKINHLTIDSNYEHALSTIVMAYLMRDVNIRYITFVDDTILFSDNAEQLEHVFDNILLELKMHGLSVNTDKNIDSGTGTGNIKELVFLPTGLRYKIAGEEIVVPFISTRKLGFQAFLRNNIRPIVTVSSSISMFRKAFLHDEATWVMANYDKLLQAEYPINIRPTPTTILDTLQYYTIRTKGLSSEEISSLLIMTEEFPSKLKWIISILKNENFNVRRFFEHHKSEYARYVSGNKSVFDKFEEYRLATEAVVVENDVQLSEVLSYMNTRECVGSELTFQAIKLTGRRDKMLYVIFDNDRYTVSTEYKPAADDGELIAPAYPYSLWKLMNQTGVSFYN